MAPRPTTPIVTVCGLGPGGRSQITGETLEAISAHDATNSFLRTRHHPTASVMAHAVSFDDVYDAGTSLDEVYDTIADVVASAAVDQGAAIYAVPGSPLVLERAVRHLRRRDDIQTRLVPAVSFLDAAWAALGVDPIEHSVRLIDGHAFGADAAGQTGPLLVAHAHARWVLSDIKLAVEAGPEQKAIVLQRLGTPDESIVEVSWPELDRSFEPDHLTSLYIPELATPVAAEFVRIVDLMHRLRQECPWDQEQTHASLRRYLLEEAYEVMEAIDEVEAGDPDGYDHLEEELGDLWFQILFHSEIGTEDGAFTIADVARTANDKLVGRHPHVFGDAIAADAAAVASNWEAIKKVEKNRASVMDGLPTALPALVYAEKVLARAERAGAPIDRRPPSDLTGTGAEPDEGALTETELGARLLDLVTAARFANLDTEQALRRAVEASRVRFVPAKNEPCSTGGSSVDAAISSLRPMTSARERHRRSVPSRDGQEQPSAPGGKGQEAIK